MKRLLLASFILFCCLNTCYGQAGGKILICNSAGVLYNSDSGITPPTYYLYHPEEAQNSPANSDHNFCIAYERRILEQLNDTVKELGDSKDEIEKLKMENQLLRVELYNRNSDKSYCRLSK